MRSCFNRTQIDAKVWIFLCICIVILFSNLGGIALLDPDEPVYAETAKEMIQFQDYLSPRIYGEFWYDKPPMYYWLVALSFKALGVSEFAARLPATLSALFCVILVSGYAAKKMNYRAGLFSGLVLVTTFEFFYLAKGAVTDSTLNLLLTACLLAMFEKRYLLGGLLAGLAVLTKGPVGLAFPAIIFAIYLIATRNLSELKRKEIWLGLIVCCCVAIPWYAAMYKVHGMPFIDTFLGFHNITRFTSPEHPETAGWYFFIPVLILGFFPWSIFMFQAVKDVIKKHFHGKNTEHESVFFLIWAMFILLFFTVSKTKLVSYILPMFSPLALLTGYYLEQLFQQKEECSIRWMSKVHVLFVLLLSGGLFYVAQAYPEIQRGSMMAASVLVGMAGSFYWIYRRYGIKGVAGMQAVGMLIFANIFVYSMVPAVEARLGCRNFGQSLQVEYDGVHTIYIAKFLRPGIAYYTDIYGQELANDVGWKKMLEKDETAYYVVTQAMFKQLSGLERDTLQIVVAEDDKVLLKKKKAK